jgi:CheY-like chemotaxis protein
MRTMVSIGGPIIIIERDVEDQALIADLFRELNHSNELVFFRDGNHAFEYLKLQDVKPFLILSDVNIPPAEAFEFRTRIQTTEGVNKKGVPYLFYFDRNSKKMYI